MEPLFGRCASVTQGAAKTMKIAGIAVPVNPACLWKASLHVGRHRAGGGAAPRSAGRPPGGNGERGKRSFGAAATLA